MLTLWFKYYLDIVPFRGNWDHFHSKAHSYTESSNPSQIGKHWRYLREQESIAYVTIDVPFTSGEGMTCLLDRKVLGIMSVVYKSPKR